ncbi:hypothetical protein UA08_02334 [Talaromyces atroroseus]|uniref:NADP-dependent oxidoreductase domain-containing protein n=1 Tax=Talaromyces atroroseus TaxID=1441469 RepID=A0A225ATM4_TALAT|nr:hypothetical protein UA08_02334 [Talaromyces atroroseus]OKL61714.1 hypothetical protein UA08_02334 [Talaromyces atroroseus]
MAVAQQPRQPKLAHVNMMTDTVIANLTPEALRSIMRSLLAVQPDLTPAFESSTRDYLHSTKPPSLPSNSSTLTSWDPSSTNAQFSATQARIRCMVGCGLCYQSLPLLRDCVEYTRSIKCGTGKKSCIGDGEFDWNKMIATLDADIVQAATAVQKTLAAETGARELSADESLLVKGLYESIISCRQNHMLNTNNGHLPFERGLMALASLLGYLPVESQSKKQKTLPVPLTSKETFLIGVRQVPRIFSGLWQLSSPAWGSATTQSMNEQFEKTVRNGLTAFDMADHYGDAEIIFGRFRASYPHADELFTATKYCVFHPIKVSREVIQANVTERCQRLQASKIDLLQFHWQFYDDQNYINALRFLQEDDRVENLGLCNFDTEHLLRVLKSGVSIQSNQVQFSLIDCRPTIKMGQVCEEHGIKLLTYGTLCGGFLAERWLGKSEPGLYDDEITPSQRKVSSTTSTLYRRRADSVKYYSMIQCWGSWDLYQELLRTLKTIAIKHNVSISNVATRWVLDFPYVGAVIVGARMGVSEHVDENLASFGWSLDQADRQAIEAILERSGKSQMFETMGDCGGEYR